jgi:hypothetical protein
MAMGVGCLAIPDAITIHQMCLAVFCWGLAALLFTGGLPAVQKGARLFAGLATSQDPPGVRIVHVQSGAIPYSIRHDEGSHTKKTGHGWTGQGLSRAWYMKIQFENTGAIAAENVTASVNFFRAVDTTVVDRTRMGAWHADGAESLAHPKYFKVVPRMEPNGQRWWLEVAMSPATVPASYIVDFDTYHMPEYIHDHLPSEPLRCRVVIRGKGLPTGLVFWFDLQNRGSEPQPLFHQITKCKVLRFLNQKIPVSTVIP